MIYYIRNVRETEPFVVAMRRVTELTVWGSGGLTASASLGFNPVIGLDVHGAEEDLAEDSHPGVVVERYHG
jgi:hypothetical protein